MAAIRYSRGIDTQIQTMTNAKKGPTDPASRRSPFGLHHTVRRFLGYAAFSAIALLVLVFCVWLKGHFWHEPLGGDGIVLWIVLVLIASLPFRMALDRLMSSGFGQEK